jgi:hypothetical protein
MRTDTGEKVLEKLATSDKVTVVIERQPDGKMRVTSRSYVILRDQVLEMRKVDGRLHTIRGGRRPDADRALRPWRAISLSATDAVSADAHSVSADAHSVSADAGTVSSDASRISADGGTVSADGGTVSADAGTVSADAGTVSADANEKLAAIRGGDQIGINRPLHTGCVLVLALAGADRLHHDHQPHQHRARGQAAVPRLKIDRSVAPKPERAGPCRMRVEFGKARCRSHGGLSLHRTNQP